MLELLLVLALVALVVLIIVIARQRTRQRQQPEGTRAHGSDQHSPPQDPFADPGTAGDPRTLKAGDMVDYLGRRYFVRGSLRLTEGGYAWSEHFLDDVEGTKRWVSVEEDPDLEVVLWEEHPAEGLYPDQATITIDGVAYQRTEHGTATYSSEGTTGLAAQGPVEYVDYEAPGDRYLSFERFGGNSWEAGLGEKVPAGALTIYPKS